MTINQFAIICEKHTIDLSIVLEDQNFIDLLKDKQTTDEQIEQYLTNNF